MALIGLQKNLRVGYMPQQVPMDAPGSVAEIAGQGLGKIGEEWERNRQIQKAVSKMSLDPNAPFNGLSGGQKHRTLLARALVHDPDLLVLDEPTNDLDVETPDLLEDLLVEYTGTLLLVSHDREFINEVVSSTLVFEGEGRVVEYVGGYDN